jgi:hypothetical protein
MIMAVIAAVFSFRKNFSLIPILGVLSCFYLMTEIPVKNWLVFAIWLLVGLTIYFGYSMKNSRLNR